MLLFTFEARCPDEFVKKICQSVAQPVFGSKLNHIFVEKEA
jgi:hypothetical protein